jgi:pilus assembly protein Flp/PilA
MLARLAKFQTTIFHARTAKERGATAVEYGLMVALIAAVIVAVVVVLGKQVNNAFQTVSDNI